MSEATEWEQLQHEFNIAREAWNSAYVEIDKVTSDFLQGKGPAPKRKMLVIVDDLTFHMHEARGALDLFILEHAH